MIRIGTAGWVFKDWEGIVYPKPRPRGFDTLRYLADYFDTVEINSSFYGPPHPSASKKWLESVANNPNFRFTAKLFRSFTHDRKPAPNDERDFKAGIALIAKADRLGALLLQFPWSFKNSPENRDYLIGLRKRFAEYPLVIEVRHGSWIEDHALDLFAELGIGMCNIDQPLFHRSVKPAAHVTSKIGYIRLHGRNYKHWFSRTANVRERYDHLYSLNELEPWADRAKQIASETTDTYVVGNNHNFGKAAVNALELRALIFGEPVEAPPSLIEAYPELQRYSASPRT
jgi:uncharacterized protein YecE (DUF72 family)